MRIIVNLSVMLSLFVMGGSLSWGQEPTPTPVHMDEARGCVDAGVRENRTIVRNGDFETNPEVGLAPPSWSAPGGLSDVVLFAEDVTNVTGEEDVNHFVQIEPGSGMSQNLNTDGVYTQYEINFCGKIINGQVKVTLGGQTIPFPRIQSEGVVGGSFSSRQPIYLSLRSSSRNRLEITFEPYEDLEGTEAEEAVAYIDNVQVVPYISGSDDEDPSPTPTPEVTPEPTPEGTPEPTFTPGPTVRPGEPTPTPTPRLTQRSLQAIADPPMLMMHMDDFAASGNQGTRKQSEITFQVIGSDGKPIDIRQVDPDAMVEIEIAESVGSGNFYVYEDNRFEQVQNRERISEYPNNRFYFSPSSPFDGVVRIIITLEYEGEVNNRKKDLELTGVVPIVVRMDPSSPLSGPTGSFDPRSNFLQGRGPGDRGMRPNRRSNLYYRERVD